MKRLALLIISALTATVISAQERLPWDIRAGVSLVSLYAAEQFPSSSSYSGGQLHYIYKDNFGVLSNTNNIGAEAILHFGKRSSVGISLSVNHFWRRRYNGITGNFSGTDKAAVVYFVPTYRVNYLQREMVRLYGAASLGFAYYFNFNNHGKSPAGAVIELAPFGLEIGRKWYGFAEFGVGTIYMGINVGAGYKF